MYWPNFLSYLLISFWHLSLTFELGNRQRKYPWHSLISSIFELLNNFMHIRLYVKSRECRSPLNLQGALKLTQYYTSHQRFKIILYFVWLLDIYWHIFAKFNLVIDYNKCESYENKVLQIYLNLPMQWSCTQPYCARFWRRSRTCLKAGDAHSSTLIALNIYCNSKSVFLLTVRVTLTLSSRLVAGLFLRISLELHRVRIPWRARSASL